MYNDSVYAQIFQPLGRSLCQTGKRAKEEEVKEASGSKKGRAALGEITNRGQSTLCQSSKENSDARCTNNERPVSGFSQHSTYNLNGSVGNTVDAHAPTPSWLIKRIRFSDQFITERETHVQPWVDIDAGDKDDPLACTSYVHQMFGNLRKAELKKRPSITYVDTVQHDINASMRAILVDWLVEVAAEYRLCLETLHLTVSYVDRYLSAVPVERTKLQLIGIACMSIASKYEEIYAPGTEEFCYITDYTYKKDELLAAESAILETLKFELTVPTANIFLARYLKAAYAENLVDHQRLEKLSTYLIELALEDFRMLQHLPSQVAASAVLLSLFLLSSSPVWSATLEHYTNYTAEDLKKCCSALHAVYCEANKTDSMTAVKEKYHHSSLTAALVHVESLPSWLFHS